mgnify:CR=1 FL=1
MQVILLERIERLGKIGEEVNVKNGFARNFLIPQGKALLANDRNRARFESEREAIEARNAEARANAESEAEKLNGTVFTLIRQAGDTGQLYGSVTARDVADAAEAVGHQRGALLVPDADKFYVLSVVQGVQDVQKGRADYAKNVGNTFLTEHFDHCFAGFHGSGQGDHLQGQIDRINL